MRFHAMRSSSAALVLCALLVGAGGCGPSAPGEDEGAGAAVGGGALGGSARASDNAKDEGASGEDSGAGEDNTGKITICHVPPGNPANAHTLTVSVNGWNGHQNHPGDFIGACDGSDGEPDDGNTPPDEGPSDPDDAPVCTPEGSLCGGDGEAECCDGLTCVDSYCRAPVIIN